MRKGESVPVAEGKLSDSFSGHYVNSSQTQKKSDDFSISIQVISSTIWDVLTLLDATPFMDLPHQEKPFDALDLLDNLLGVNSCLISDTCSSTNKSLNSRATAFGKLMMACKAPNSDDPVLNNETIIRTAQTLERYSDPTILFLASPFFIDLKQIKSTRAHLKRAHEDSARFKDDRLAKIARKALSLYPGIVACEKITSNPEGYYTFENLAVYTVMALEIILDTLQDTMRECVKLVSQFCDLIGVIVSTVMPKIVNVAGIQFNDREIVANIIRFNTWWKDSPYLPLKSSSGQNNVMLDPTVVLRNDTLLKIPVAILQQLSDNADCISKVMEMHPIGIKGVLTPINRCSFKMLTLHTHLIHSVQRLVNLMGFQPGKLESTRQNGFAFLHQSFKQMYFMSYPVNSGAKAVQDRGASTSITGADGSSKKSGDSPRRVSERSEGLPISPPMLKLRRPSDPAIGLSSFPSIPELGGLSPRIEESPRLETKEEYHKEGILPRLRERRRGTSNRPVGVSRISLNEIVRVEATSPSALEGGGEEVMLLK